MSRFAGMSRITTDVRTCAALRHTLPYHKPPARRMHVEFDDRDAPCFPGSASLRKIPDMAAVNKIVGPVAPPPSPPPPPSPEEAVETHRVDTEQATAAKAALFRLFANVTLTVPDWTDHCAALSLLPSRASQKHDYEVLKSLREHQARYVDLLITIKENQFQ